MKTVRISYWITIFLLLAGCSVNPSIPTETFLIEPTPLLPATAFTFSPLLQSTQTPQMENISATYTPFTTPINSFRVQRQCPEEGLGIRDLEDLKGTLVFSAGNRLSENGILSPATGKDSMLSFWEPRWDRISFYNLEEEEKYYYYAESPNKEKLAFTEGKTAPISLDLIILDHQGQELGRRIVPDDWRFYHWLNDDQLLLQQFKPNKEFDLVALNLTEQGERVLPTNFLNADLFQLYWDWGSQILFNSDSTLALYPQRKLDLDQIYTVLWDTNASKEIAKIAGSGWARWSPDGGRFLVTADFQSKVFSKQYDILLVNTKGEQSRATFFAASYENYWIEQPTWSPNSRYVAFWLITQYPGRNAQLGVLDTATQQVDLYCKKFDPRPFRFGDSMGVALGYADMRVNSAIPIWSPDSNYILIENRIGVDSSTYLYDLRNYMVTKIADKARPVGWLR